MDTEDEMTVAEAAELLGCSVQHVRWYYRKGHLPGRRIGNLVLMFPRADVEKLAANKPKKTGRPPKGEPVPEPKPAAKGKRKKK